MGATLAATCLCRMDSVLVSTALYWFVPVCTGLYWFHYITAACTTVPLSATVESGSGYWNEEAQSIFNYCYGNRHHIDKWTKPTKCHCKSMDQSGLSCFSCGDGKPKINLSVLVGLLVGSDIHIVYKC